VPHERQLAGARRGLALLASLGITSIQNAHGTPAEVELFRELRDAGELTLRVGVAQTLRPPVTKDQVDAIRALAGRHADGPLRVVAVKLVVDGVIEAHTAAMLAPYSDEPDTRGLPAWSQEHLNEVAARVDAAGLQIYAHAIGDAGVRMALDAFAHARRVNGRRDARHRVEHIETIDPADLPRFKELEVLASMMPIHADPGTIDAWAKAAGPARTGRAFAWRLLERAGARLVFSSDWPSALSVDPWRGLHCAVNRRTAEGQPPGGWLSEHRVSVEEALTAYTSAGAYAEFQEGQKGALTPGRLADIVVLNADPFALPPERLHSLRAALTVVGGRVVYEAP
jgi:predicted amidohydrolase YtcJ